MQFTLPIEMPSDFADQIASLVLKQVDERIKLSNSAIELPLYPNRSELKKVLKIGDEKIDSWISEGLPMVLWSKKEHRFDRDDIKEHINKMKITG